MVTLLMFTFLLVVGFTITAIDIDIIVAIIFTILYIFVDVFVFIVVFYVKKIML